MQTDKQELLAENAELRTCLRDAEEMLNAIRGGEVDALVVSSGEGDKIFTLEGADQPYRVLVETMSEGAATLSPDSTVLFCNSRLARLLGMPMEKILGKPLLTHVDPADSSVLMGLLEKSLGENYRLEESCRAELTLVTAKRNTVPAQLSCCSLDLAGNREVSVIITDLSEQKRNEEIVTAGLLASSILEQASEAIIVCDGSGQVIRASRQSHELLGTNPIFRSFDTLGSLKESRTGRTFSIAAPLNGESFQGVETIFQRNDRKYHLLLNAKPFFVREKMRGCVLTLTDITERKHNEDELEFQATHDGLTGLANRTLLHDRLEQLVHFAHRSGRWVGVLLLDLDRFKIINDSLGHDFGDQLLCAVAQRLRKSVRNADTVARLGGDEFVILLAEVAHQEDVGNVAKKISEKLNAPYRIDNREITVTASIGISIYPRDSNDGAILIRNADMAMYQAKKDGSRISLYMSEMSERAFAEMELESDLRQALAHGEFCLHYQPKIDLASGCVVGCEALVRWNHPQRGMISPADFIPLAEETGLIVPLGNWILEEACRQGKEWQDAGLPELSIAVNLSARQFRKGDLQQLVQSALDNAGLESRRLELELTESMVMDNPAKAERTMQSLKDLGVSLSLDDFGTGFSSLNYLRRFPVDSLKIDRSFIRDVVTDQSGASVVTSVIAIAHNLGLTAVAEGVETREQLSFLLDCDCDMFQGFLFSKPLSVEEFTIQLREGRRLTGL